MNFVLIGSDPLSDIFVTAAVAQNHRLLAYVRLPTDPDTPDEYAQVPILGDLEAVAGVRGVDFLVLSGDLAGRADRLRRILRLEPVDLVIVTPVADQPDVYYELICVQNETHLRVLPLIPEAAHPARGRIRQLLREYNHGAIRWIEWIQPLVSPAAGPQRFLDGWIWARDWCGEIAAVSATGTGSSADLSSQVVVSAPSQSQGMTTFRWLADTAGSRRLHIECEHGQINCELSAGFTGPARIGYSADPSGSEQVACDSLGKRWLEQWHALTAHESQSLWAEATRALELAEAVQRSLARQRMVSLCYDQATEETSFRSLMTALGCGLLVAVLVIGVLVMVIQPWVPFDSYLAFVALPAVVFFLLLQLLGRVARPRRESNRWTETAGGQTLNRNQITSPSETT